jgi:hypothetical protein
MVMEFYMIKMVLLKFRAILKMIELIYLNNYYDVNYYYSYKQLRELKVIIKLKKFN